MGNSPARQLALKNHVSAHEVAVKSSSMNVVDSAPVPRSEDSAEMPWGHVALVLFKYS